MYLSLNWLKEYLITEASNEKIASTLTSIGFEVEEEINYANIYKDFVIGEIISVEKHPNADKLNLCQVFTGTLTQRIVCGASNVRSGLKVVVSQLGAIIPANGMKIVKAKIRGIESEGMICSESELNLSKETEGIMELEAGEPGQKFSEYYFADDITLKLNITPNRNDCNSVYGLARELYAAGLGELLLLETPDYLKKISNPINLNNLSLDFFSNTFASGIKNMVTPKELKRKLMVSNMVSHNLIVDVINIVLLLTGYPLHVYDYNKISGGLLTIKKVDEERDLIDLKGETITLNNDSYISLDASGEVLAVIGIIGSQKAMVKENTTDIIVECAFISSEQTIKSGKNIPYRTEARSRFEKGADYNMAIKSLEIALGMLFKYSGCEISENIIAVNNPPLNSMTLIEYDLNSYEKAIGAPIPKEFAMNLFNRLNLDPKDNGVSILLSPPSYRPDLKDERDITEEIIRFYGYDKIKEIADYPSAAEVNNEIYKKIFSLKKILAARGYKELINLSFINKEELGIFCKSPSSPDLTIINPISPELSYMPPTLIINLIKSLAYNLNNYKIESVSLFELGMVFQSHHFKGQSNCAAGIRYNQNNIADHYHEERPFDCFDIKADIKAMLENIFYCCNYSLEKAHIDYGQSGRSFIILNSQKQVIGQCGEIKLAIAQNYSIAGKIYFFELFIDSIQVEGSKSASEFDVLLGKDMSFYVDDDIIIGDLLKNIHKASPLVKKIILRDIYNAAENKNNSSENNRKSIALTIFFNNSNNLTSEEINLLLKKISNDLFNKQRAVLRGNL